MRTRAVRAVTLIGAVALAITACEPDVASVLRAPAPGSGSPAALEILAPTGVQVAGSPTVDVDVALGDRVVAPSLRIVLDGPLGDVTLRRRDLTITAGHARATVPLARLGTGLVGLTASAAVRGDGRARDSALFSNEPDLDVVDGGRCEVLGQSRCLLPFPSNRFTVPDPSTDTGRRVALAQEAMPASTYAGPIDPTEWNRNDGFSPGAALVVHVPGVDVAQSNLPTIGRMADYADPGAGVVVVDVDTGERWPVWAELDEWATDDATRALFVRPARNFLEGHTYAVGLRSLRSASGALLPVEREFEVLRDGTPTFVDAIEARRPAMDATLAALAAADVDTSTLNLAWDFTVASERNLTERVLAMRDDAYARIGSSPPAFTVTGVQDDVSSTVWRRVRGTYDVPMYLTGGGQPGARISYGADGLPQHTGTWKASFVCNIPRSVYGGGTVVPGRALVYGHGLLGSGDEVNARGALLDAHQMVGCATDWIGMSDDDIGNVAATLVDLSKFPTLPDRLQQSFVNFQFLAKLMKDADGFGAHPAFQAGAASTPVIASGAVFFNGNSQGGIAGGAATAISKEWTRAALGVPGINYSTLLTRSVHWDTFSLLMYDAYPDELDRAVLFTVIQMLWDRGEGNGYAHHMTDDPLPGTPPHAVLLIEAFGDHQVANVATETEARTIGARLWTPALQDGRTDLPQPFFGLEPVGTTPYDGSVLVVWDFGTPAPPPGNTPPRPPEHGDDPHGMGGGEPRVGEQVSRFLRVDGTFVDVCGGGPCVSGP